MLPRLLAIPTLLLLVVSHTLGNAPLLEYQVKAVAIVNVIRFTTWPAAALPEPPAPIVIGIWGDNPFGRLLDDVVSTERLHSRALRVQRFPSDGRPSGCHIVFVSRSEQNRMRTVIEELHRDGVLTISQIEGFAQNGGIVGMTLVGGNLRFQVNVETARKAGLKLDARFLSIARVVR